MKRAPGMLAELIVALLVGGTIGFWSHTFFRSPILTGVLTVIAAGVVVASIQEWSKTRGLITQHFRDLWRGRYSTRRAVAYLLLGTIAIPAFLLILLVPWAYAVHAIIGWKPPTEFLGEALNLPMLAYVLVAMVGTWASATRQQRAMHSAGDERPIVPVLAKALVVVYAIGWSSIGFALMWLWFGG